MLKTVGPGKPLEGTLTLPGDKSISHRYAMLGAIAEGRTVIRNYATGADCQTTLNVLRNLGVRIELYDGEVVIEGRGPGGFIPPEVELDAGNSGTTMRLLSGILAAQPFESVLVGDESLSRRPMDRIVRPLELMGAHIEAREGRYPPLRIRGNQLRGIEYEVPVPSAQVKSCLLLAGLHAEGETIVREAARTRDHTEIALRQFGAQLETRRGMVRLPGRQVLHGREDLIVPGDLSSAAFFIVAATIVPDSELVIAGVGLNPTRAALLDFLLSIGASIRVLDVKTVNGELVGSLLVRSARVKGGRIEGALTAALIDEIPVLAVLGAVSEGGLEVRDARELRVKETDRIEAIAENLQRMGARVEVWEDGFRVAGNQQLRGAELDSFGDHRIAMAFSVAALVAQQPCKIHGAEAASVSFPEFYDILDKLRED